MWTICYFLMLRQSRRNKTYGMPLFALALNFSWEIIYALFVVETRVEFVVFGVWLIIDIGLVFYMLKYGKREWAYAPFVEKNLGLILVAMIIYCSLGHYAFAKWWIDNDIGKKEGKFYRGVMGPDTTELAFWSAAFVGAYLSVASLAQLLVRGHTGGLSWGIWYISCHSNLHTLTSDRATRNLGSIIGFNVVFLYEWYIWREAHEYVMSPFGIFLWGTALVTDLVYPFYFSKIRKTEKRLPDGSKVRGGNVAFEKKAY